MILGLVGFILGDIIVVLITDVMKVAYNKIISFISFAIKMFIKVSMIMILGVVGFILGKIIAVLITPVITAICDKLRSFYEKTEPEKEAVRLEENSKKEAE
jgi:hypothetical protein